MKRRVVGTVEFEELRPAKEGRILLDGEFSFIARSDAIESALEEQFGRNGLCLKVLKGSDGPGPYTWDGTPIEECVFVQNLFAQRGVAPRVFGLVKVQSKKDQWLAMVTSFLKGASTREPSSGMRQEERKKLESIRRAIGGIKLKWDHNPDNWRNEQLNGESTGGRMFTDFGGSSVESREEFLLKLESDADKNADWGSKSYAYQSPPPLRIESQRDAEKRADRMELGRLDLNGADVLDIGCSLGAMLQETCQLGARRAVGIDIEKVVRTGFACAMWEGWLNVDMIPMRLAKGRSYVEEIRGAAGLKRFDLLLALSIDHQIGYRSWMTELVKDDGMAFVEGHVGQGKRDFDDRLERDWIDVEWLGKTYDAGPRPLFRCGGVKR